MNKNDLTILNAGILGLLNLETCSTTSSKEEEVDPDVPNEHYRASNNYDFSTSEGGLNLHNKTNLTKQNVYDSPIAATT